MFKTGDHYAMPGHDHEAAREWVKGYCVKPAPWKGQSNIHTLCYLLRDVLSDYDALQARVRELEQRLGEVEAGRECVHIDEYQAVQDRVQELEAKLAEETAVLDAIYEASDGLPQDGPSRGAARVYYTLPEQITRLRSKLAEVERERDRLREAFRYLNVRVKA